ncbi:MAG: N-acetylmuramoyl-L-alanine amidase [Bacteroidales bacterium]|nr:N-acetylmuramoyl-L-alanine amidase [Bacteroidales bacterium]
MKIRLLLSFCLLVFGLSAFSQSDSLRTVVAQQGDGIYKLLRDNGYDAKLYYHKFLELNKDKIQLEDQLILGETYFLPKHDSDSVADRIVTIDTIASPTQSPTQTPPELPQSKMDLRIADTIRGNALKGAIFYLIAGHGGPDPGATSVVDGHLIPEDEYAFDITLRLAKFIEEQSGKVYMIIDDPDDGIRNDRILKIDYDEFVYPGSEISRDKNQRLLERADAVNKLFYANKSVKYQRVVEIHLDSRAKEQRVDAFFYYSQGSEKGRILAETMLDVFKNKYAKFQPNRGYYGSVSMRNLLVIRRVIPPAAFMEAGNIQNEKDRKRLLDANNRQALAKWLYEALVIDYNRYKNK